MRWLQRFRMATLMFFRREKETAKLNNELQFHLDQQISENVSNGMNPSEARTAALRLFGNPTLLRDSARETWSWNWTEKLGRDLRYGIRTLSRSPGFAIVAILVIALGIGATISLFTIVRAVLLKPLPFRDPDKLYMVYEHFRSSTSGDGFSDVSPADYTDWKKQTHGFEDLAAWRDYGFNLTGEHTDLPEVVEAAAGSANLFSLLGVNLPYGRTFTESEDQPEADHVVLLTWSLFQRRFAGDPSIVGKTVRLDSNSYTVIGVLPSWFTYPRPQVQVWVPYASTFTREQFAEHDNHQTQVIARTRQDVSVVTATNEVGAVQYQLHQANSTKPVAEDARTRPMLQDLVQDVKTPLIVLQCAVGCMLLIACLNVSNLFVARGAARRREVAVRGALGGGRLTLILEQMTESFVICTVGGVAGLLISLIATHWLATHWSELPRAESIRLDGTVVMFSFCLIFVTTLLAGLLPAITSTGKGIFSTLQESSRSVGGSASRAMLRKTLLTTEIALTVILLLCAGLLFKSFLHLRTSDLGCATDHVLTMKYGLPEKQYDTRDKVVAFHEALLTRIRRLPGVRSAALVSTPPGGGFEGDLIFTIPERPSDRFDIGMEAIIRTIDPEYFKTMQIPLIRGRFFTDQERLTNDHYIIVSKKFADKFFPNENPIGRHATVSYDSKPADYEIIGVAGDTLWNAAKPTRATIYFPILSGIPSKASSATIVVRTTGDPLNMSIPIQRQIAALDPAQPVYEVLTMQQILGKSTASQSFSAMLVLAFTFLSLLLAAIGLYGVLSYLVTQRMAEIGIRIALGAQRKEVLRLVLLDGLRPVFIGLLIGLAGGVAAGMLIRSILYGISPLDPAVFTVMTGSLLLTAIAACALPAIRASRIEPMQALRNE